MKFRKIRLLRPEFEVEFKKPIVGRLYLFFKFPTLCKVIKQRLYINITGKFGYADCGKGCVKNIYYICIPKIKVTKERK